MHASGCNLFSFSSFQPPLQSSHDAVGPDASALSCQVTAEIFQLLLARGGSKEVMDASGRFPYKLADQVDIRMLLSSPDGR